MLIAVDFHIHTALSPCADDDMTPNNIVNMALLKKLDAIAITDHNSCENVMPVIKAAAGRLLVIPGIEVQTKEEVHILCYFMNVESLYDFNFIINKKLPKINNLPEIFGHQHIFDENDNIIDEKKPLLISSADISIDELVSTVSSLGGVAVPAHINRQKNGIITQLGFIPDYLNFNLIEISQKDVVGYKNDLKYNFLVSSDAHYLGNILERKMFLNVEHLSHHAIFSYLRDPNTIKSYFI